MVQVLVMRVFLVDEVERDRVNGTSGGVIFWKHGDHNTLFWSKCIRLSVAWSPVLARVGGALFIEITVMNIRLYCSTLALLCKRRFSALQCPLPERDPDIVLMVEAR